MYLNFYNLKREPFNITPDPDLLFLSPSHKEALAAVIYGVSKRKGFVAITGEVGTGKTTILRSFLARADKQAIRTIYIFNSNIPFNALLKTIFQNMGSVPETDDICMMVNQLQMMLIEEYKAGRNVVLIIDEAQNMPVETLENLRMLSNLETATDKLIQIVLSGQPELEQKLALHTLRQLNQRIAIRVRIRPLSRKESLEYIDYRLGKSLAKDTDIFTRGALDLIAGKANGIPRVINILCDNCLITTFGNNQKKVTARVAREIIAEQTGAGRAGRRWIFACATAVLTVVCSSLIYLNSGVTVTAFAPATPGKKVEAAATVPAGITSVQPGQAIPATERQNIVATRAAVEVEQHSQAVQDEKRSRLTRIAKKGDTLAGLVKETYGSVDGRLLELVRRHNPVITNINMIMEGEKIYFPAREPAYQ